MTRIQSALIVALALIIAPSIFAATCSSTTDCTFNFDSNNGFTAATGPYGTVELTLVGSTIKVTLNTPGFNLIQTGFPGVFGYNDNLNDTSAFTIASAGLPTGYGNTSLNNGGNDVESNGNDQHFDGLGYFDDAALSGPHNGDANDVSSLSFTISRTGGFTSVQQLIEADSDGYYFAADVGITGAATGLIGVKNLTSPVPEPRTYVALIAGFFAIAFFARRKRANTQTV